MKIAIVRLSSLGDIIHSMIILQFIKDKFPQSEIHWIADSSFVPLLQCSQNIDKIHGFNIRKTKGFFNKIKLLKKIKKLKDENFDIAVDMQGLLKSTMITNSICKNSWGFSFNAAREKVSSFFIKNKVFIPYKENIYIRNLKLIDKALKLDIDFNSKFLKNRKKYINFSKDSLKKVESQINQNNKNIILIPSATTPERVIHPDIYIKLIKNIPYKFHIIWGNQKEHDLCKKIKENATELNILPKLSIEELTAVISLSDLTIGPDTGPSNIAFALKKPSLTIYWKGAKNAASRNSFETEINKTLVFENMQHIDHQIILDKIFDIIDINKI